MNYILAINPGSTSTKIAVYNGREEVFEKVIRHDVSELEKFESVSAQYEFRYDAIVDALAENKLAISDLSAVACRGGVTKPQQGGTYLVTDEVCNVQMTTPYQHPANLAAIIGKKIADEVGIEAYYVDSPMTYELDPLATYTGIKEFKHLARGHALNQKATARKHAEVMNKGYDDVTLIVAHLGHLEQ